jgi:16S rRNA (uracil1498-N3)-methyltransferase
MRLHRFIGDFDCSRDVIEITDADTVNQLANVLRLGVGDRLILGDGKRNECIGEISARQKHMLTVTVVERSENKNDPAIFGTLYCAILKRENFELVVQKATEIGIGEIVPLVTARTVKLDIKEDRLQKIIKEAAEQSGRGRLPILHKPIQLFEAFAHAHGNDVNFFFALGDTSASVDALRTGMRRGLFVGPEGGWTDEETAAAQAAGCAIVSLGTLTLRAETAAIIVSYLGTRS